MLVTVLFGGIIIILILAYLRGKYNENYWKQRGVRFYKKHKSGGPFLEFAIGKQSFFQILLDIYNKNADAPAVGLGSFFNKALYVKDLVNMQHIFQTDFQSFYHRGLPISEEDVLANNIVFLNGPKWKLIRHKLTPIFTIAKLKNMYYILDKSAEDFIDFLNKNPDRLKGNTYGTITYYTTAALAASVFGIGTKSSFDSPFSTMAASALASTTANNIKFVIGGLSNKIFKALKIKLFDKHEGFFVEAIRQVIRQREKDGVKKHDFVDMCVNLQKNGTMQDPDTGFTLEPTDEMLAAQAFFFFLAGNEPSASALYATLLELGRHPDVLKRVQEEIDALFEKNSKLTYDCVHGLEYLNTVFKESIRLHNPLGFLTRQCTRDTVLPVGNIHVEKGVKIFLPIYEVHHDPKYYPNPEVFDPDRFSRDGEVNDMAYLPFGKGNRHCIGDRYARTQILSGLIHFLKHYEPKTLVHKGGIKYKKEQNMVKLTNVDVEFVPRKL